MKIMVVNNSMFDKVKKNTLIRGVEAVNLLDKIRRNPKWIERDLIEEDTNYRQVIPYILINNKTTGLFLLTKRTKKQAEKRLHNKYSIGIGGHIEYFETANWWSDPIHITLVKELKEETGIKLEGLTISFQGIILTDKKPIDKVHVGCLCHLISPYNNLKDEDGKHEHQWADKKTLIEHYNRMESWSKIVFDNYISA